MNFPICIHRKQNASFRIASLTLAITLLWLVLSAANTSVNAQTTSSPADWTEFHRDNMQRWNPYETVLGAGILGSVQLKWKNTTGIGNTSSFLQSSPAVADGTVYIGSTDGKVDALDASTGAVLWSFTPVETSSFGNSFGTPAVSNGVVYVGSVNSYVYAINASTGVQLWSFDTESMFGLGGPVEAAPTVANGIVYIGDVQAIYALDAATGAVVWSLKEPEVIGSPAVTNGVVYATTAGGDLQALDARTGHLLWSFRPNQCCYLATAPAVADGLVYIGSPDGKVYAVNATSGTLVWNFDTSSLLPGGVDSSPAVANGVVYIGAYDGKVYALNATTGALLWSFNTGSGTVVGCCSGALGGVRSAPAVANGVVYFGSSSGDFYALNAGTGAMLWSYYTGPAGYSSPVVVDGVVYMRGGDLNPKAPASQVTHTYAFAPSSANLGDADLFLRIRPIPATVHSGDLITYTFPVWNLGPKNAVHEVLTTQVPQGTRFDYIRISGTPGLATCTTPPYQQNGQVACFENSSMAPNTTWTIRLTVQVEDGLKAGTVITESATVTDDTLDPNWSNNTATLSTTVQ